MDKAQLNQFYAYLVERNRAAARKRAAERLYLLNWRSTGAQYVTGRANAAAALGVSEASLGVYLSNGKAARGLQRRNPQTGELDVVTVQSPKPPPKRKRGRPPKPGA